MPTENTNLFTLRIGAAAVAAPLAVAASASGAIDYSPASGASFPEGTTVNFEVDMHNGLINYVQAWWYVDGGYMEYTSENYGAFSRSQHFADDGSHDWQVHGSWNTENSLDNPYDSGIIPFTIENVDPHFVDVPFDNIVDFAGSSVFPFSATGADPGVLDVLTFSWDLDGDGQYDDFVGQSGAFDYATIAGLTEGQVIPVGIRLDDGDGGEAFATFNVTVINVVPAPGTALCAALGSAALGRRRR